MPSRVPAIASGLRVRLETATATAAEASRLVRYARCERAQRAQRARRGRWVVDILIHTLYTKGNLPEPESRMRSTILTLPVAHRFENKAAVLQRHVGRLRPIFSTARRRDAVRAWRLRHRSLNRPRQRAHDEAGRLRGKIIDSSWV